MTRFASLVGLTVAKQLISDLDRAPTRVASVYTKRLQMSARRTDAGTLVLWGHISGPTYQHASRAGLRLEHTYVRAADQVAAVNAQVTRLMLREAAERPLLDAREACYMLGESRVIPDEWMAEGWTPPNGIPDCYDQMSLEHCAAWMPILQALPVKAAAVA